MFRRCSNRCFFKGFGLNSGGGGSSTFGFSSQGGGFPFGSRGGGGGGGLANFFGSPGGSSASSSAGPGSSFFSNPNNPLGGFFNKALEWCSTSHAYDIARQEGIEMRDIQFNTLPNGTVEVRVDAPKATQQQIEALGKRVEEECPVARFRKQQNTKMQMRQETRSTSDTVGGEPSAAQGKESTASSGMKWLRLPDRYDR